MLGKRTRKGKKYLLVAYVGYPERFNSWVPESDIAGADEFLKLNK